MKFAATIIGLSSIIALSHAVTDNTEQEYQDLWVPLHAALSAGNPEKPGNNKGIPDWAVCGGSHNNGACKCTNKGPAAEIACTNKKITSVYFNDNNMIGADNKFPDEAVNDFIKGIVALGASGNEEFTKIEILGDNATLQGQGVDGCVDVPECYKDVECNFGPDRPLCPLTDEPTVSPTIGSPETSASPTVSPTIGSQETSASPTMSPSVVPTVSPTSLPTEPAAWADNTEQDFQFLWIPLHAALSAGNPEKTGNNNGIPDWAVCGGSHNNGACKCTNKGSAAEIACKNKKITSVSFNDNNMIGADNKFPDKAVNDFIKGIVDLGASGDEKFTKIEILGDKDTLQGQGEGGCVYVPECYKDVECNFGPDRPLCPLTDEPTVSPTDFIEPTTSPSVSPTIGEEQQQPSVSPTVSPSEEVVVGLPTVSPTTSPSEDSSSGAIPTATPTVAPIEAQAEAPTVAPTSEPTTSDGSRQTNPPTRSNDNTAGASCAKISAFALIATVFVQMH